MKGIIRVFVVFTVLGLVTFAWLRFRPVKATQPPAAVNVPEPTPIPSASPEVSSVEVIPTQAVAPLPVEIAIDESTHTTWTSRDGRTIKADYVSATSTTVTIRRSDNAVFTIPIANLSADDSAWIAKQPKPIEPAPASLPAVTPSKPLILITQQQLDKIIASFPAAPALNGREVTNDLQQLHIKYLGMVKFFRPNTLGPSIKMIRSKISDDIKVLSNIAGTSSGDWSGKRGSSQSAAAENAILSARKSISWLEGPLSSHIKSYESLMAVSE
ncbi:MAG TPA: hypothetical protein VK968_07580 [Roseimicrobium sp.]|nr:hypothetical protein [Roseimicrobium sp.]